MRVLILVLALLWSTGALAQEALTINTPPGKPLVWYPDIVIPDHEPETEFVVFRLLESDAETADVPFFIDRIGVVIPRERSEEIVEAFWRDRPDTLLLCSVPEGSSPNLVRSQDRRQFCTLRRTGERQP